MRSHILIAPAAFWSLLWLAGCGGGSPAIPPPPVVNVTLSPSTVSVKVGAQFPFHVTVTGSTNTAVVWQVNGVPGGTLRLRHNRCQRGVHRTSSPTRASDRHGYRRSAGRYREVRIIQPHRDHRGYSFAIRCFLGR